MNPGHILAVQQHDAGNSSDYQNVRALLVSPFEDDRLALQHIFGQNNWNLFEAQSYKEALDFFTKNRVPIVICNPLSGGGDWKDLVSHLAPLPQPPRVFVVSDTIDRALEMKVSEQAEGDVLRKPFDGEEVTRKIRSAWLVWQKQITAMVNQSTPESVVPTRQPFYRCSVALSIEANMPEPKISTIADENDVPAIETDRSCETKPVPEMIDHMEQKRIAQLAYLHWENRGRPFGSPEEDWFLAEHEIQRLYGEG